MTSRILEHPLDTPLNTDALYNVLFISIAFLLFITSLNKNLDFVTRPNKPFYKLTLYT